MRDAHTHTLAHLKSHFEALRIRFAVVGGFAVGVRVRPRMTKDVDLAVAVSGDEEAEALVYRLSSSGNFRVFSEDVIEHTATGRLSTVRLRSAPAGSGRPEADLLFASSGIEPEIVEAATDEQVSNDLSLRVACIGHLIALKVLSEHPHRPQDRIDLHALMRIATKQDMSLARNALHLITSRGFHRSLDLIRRLNGFLGEVDQS